MSINSATIASDGMDPDLRMADAPIFLTGFARSGTTWLNQLMRDYFDAGFVNEGQFIVSFGKRIGRYGNLHEPENRNRLIRDLAEDDFFAILKRNYRVELDWSRVFGSGDSFSTMVKCILWQIAEQLGKRRMGSKYPVFGRHLGLLNSLFPDCRVIHVVRDGRDCAMSHRNLTWGYQNAYSAATHWRDYLATVAGAAGTLGSRFLEIRYEDLLIDPEATMRSLERFVAGSNEDQITRRFMEDMRLLKRDKVEQWRVTMPSRSRAIFESVAGDTLRRYGYPLTGTYRPPSLLSRMAYTVHNRVTREGFSLARKIFRNMSEKKGHAQRF